MKLAFSTATALALLTGYAYAGGDNEAYLYQDGSFNSASIDQSAGSGNDAGSSAQNIIQRRTPLGLQAGKNNVLTIVQSGNDNKIGLGTNANTFGHATGVYQDQSYGGSSTYAAARNLIDITQSSDNNEVGAVSQYTATHAGNNSLTVTQGGGGHNVIGSVSQYRIQTTQNVADIDQSGGNNTIARIEQYTWNYGGTLGQATNDLGVTMSGDNNGNGALGGFALASGAQSSTLIQGGPGLSATASFAHLDISGDYNQFGVTQYGEGNTVGALTISGDSNEVGTYQQGSHNTIALAAVAGFGNNVGIRQDGNTNNASVSVTDDDNSFGVQQTGVDNVADVTASGGENGGFHDFTPLTPAAGLGLTAGLLQQNGTFNQATLTVSGGGNVFASLQDNSSSATSTWNRITASQSGDGNQAAISQVGNANTASLAQSGGGNNAAISQ